MKGLAVGSGAVIAGKSLPDNWMRPAVDSVILPAHAQTSVLGSSGPATLVRVTQNQLDDGSLLANVKDTLLPQAIADVLVSTSIPQVCVEPVRIGGEQPDVVNVKAMSVRDEKCLISEMLMAGNVPVNPEAQTPMTNSPLCGFGDAGEWLEQLGLINEAQASAPLTVSVHTLNGPNGGAFGYINYMGLLFKFDLARGECPGFTPQCDCPD